MERGCACLSSPASSPAPATAATHKVAASDFPKNCDMRRSADERAEKPPQPQGEHDTQWCFCIF